MGLPEDPRPRGAVCSTLPPMRQPRGPRKARPTAETVPKVTRRPPPTVAATANTALPPDAPDPGSHWMAGASPVSTVRPARSPSTATPAAVPTPTRPSAKVTVVSGPLRLWALVSTSPPAVTTPFPRPKPFPMRTTEGPTRSPTLATAASNCSRNSTSRTPLSIASDLWVTRYHGPRAVTPGGHHGARKMGAMEERDERDGGDERPAPLAAALARVGDRWSLLVVDALLGG